jgi:hypothetical protein
VFQTLGRKCADAQWKHPDIGEGKIQRWPDSVSPVPRHVGILGLICRAEDGRPEMWPWITAYVQFHLNHWCLKRVKDPTLFYGLREGAFCLHYAVALAKVHPDPAVRAQLIADIENVCINYYGRLQQADGSWRWDDVDFVDSDGGTLKGIMQAFMVGLLLCALGDADDVVGAAAKASIKTQILTACRHLYEGGPYSRIKPVNFNVLTRGFNYFYHGGTSVNPTKYAKGDIPEIWTTTERWHIESARQAISTVVGAFGKAYQLSGDPFFKTAGDELWNSAYSGDDGFRAMMADTAKNFNQHARWAGRYPALVGGVSQPDPAPLPNPTPTPQPPPPPSPTTSQAAITSPVSGAKVSGVINVEATASDPAGIFEVYLVVDGLTRGPVRTAPYTFQLDTAKLSDGRHDLYVRAWTKTGTAIDSKPTVTIEVANTPTPDPDPEPTPTPEPCSMTVSPSELTLAPGAMGTITVILQNMIEPAEVRAISSSGQVSVNPGLKKITGTSASIQFQVAVKKRGGSITFSSGCGSKTVIVNVS